MAILGQHSPTTYRTDNVFIATAGQVTFYSFYNPAAVDVYSNGAKLAPGRDYTANDGISIALTSPALSGDVIEIVAFKVNLHSLDFTSAPIPVSVDAGIANGQQYLMTSSCNLSLPSNPLPNWKVRVFNVTNTTTGKILRNGQLINGINDDLTIDILNTSVTLIYVNSTTGWWVF